MEHSTTSRPPAGARFVGALINVVLLLVMLGIGALVALTLLGIDPRGVLSPQASAPAPTAAPQPTAAIVAPAPAPQPGTVIVQQPAAPAPAEMAPAPAVEGTHASAHPLPPIVVQDAAPATAPTAAPQGGIDVGGSVHVGGDGFASEGSVSIKNAAPASDAGAGEGTHRGRAFK